MELCCWGNEPRYLTDLYIKEGVCCNKNGQNEKEKDTNGDRKRNAIQKRRF